MGNGTIENEKCVCVGTMVPFFFVGSFFLSFFLLCGGPLLTPSIYIYIYICVPSKMHHAADAPCPTLTQPTPEVFSICLAPLSFLVNVQG